jgi:hypothetical protein
VKIPFLADSLGKLPKTRPRQPRINSLTSRRKQDYKNRLPNGPKEHSPDNQIEVNLYAVEQSAQPHLAAANPAPYLTLPKGKSEEKED